VAGEKVSGARKERGQSGTRGAEDEDAAGGNLLADDEDEVRGQQEEMQ